MFTIVFFPTSPLSLAPGASIYPLSSCYYATENSICNELIKFHQVFLPAALAKACCSSVISPPTRERKGECRKACSLSRVSTDSLKRNAKILANLRTRERESSAKVLLEAESMNFDLGDKLDDHFDDKTKPLENS
ncbi:hypothetical protein AVEN_127400-1 [Araneus ventricosus]|uniref:Uncharacterized protein n=1 Tax=Araneus ventricosus TaxID=182803 RepID=A0A4Y2HNI1_ARAVE|nr:hypothetical protein AVEN_127400-1 [Araneus ventricosus]